MGDQVPKSVKNDTGSQRGIRSRTTWDLGSLYAGPPSEKDQHELLAMKFGGASRDELVRAVQRNKRPTNGVRTSRISCPLPSGVTVTVSGSEIGMDEGIEALAVAAKEMKKARRRIGREDRSSGVGAGPRKEEAHVV